MCRAAEEAGWTAGPLDAAGPADLADLLAWPGRTVVAVEYAETRPDLVTELLKRLLRRRGGPPCRVVLVVRQGGARQGLVDLFATGDARDEVAGLLRRAEFVGLGHGERELDRRDLFAAATPEFARLLDGAAPPVPDLRAEHFERPLFVLAAALLAVANPELDVAGLSAEQLMDEILDRHGAVYWERSDTRAGLALDPADRRTAVALAVLCGLHGDEDDERLVRLVPSPRDTLAERATSVVRWLRGLYGAQGTLEPDLLAEVLAARTITDAPELVGAALERWVRCAARPGPGRGEPGRRPLRTGASRGLGRPTSACSPWPGPPASTRPTPSSPIPPRKTRSRRRERINASTSPGSPPASTTVPRNRSSPTPWRPWRWAPPPRRRGRWPAAGRPAPPGNGRRSCAGSTTTQSPTPTSTPPASAPP